MNTELKKLIYAYLVVQNEDLKTKGYIPTLDLVIERLEKEVEEMELETNK